MSAERVVWECDLSKLKPMKIPECAEEAMIEMASLVWDIVVRLYDFT